MQMQEVSDFGADSIAVWSRNGRAIVFELLETVFLVQSKDGIDSETICPS